MAALKLMKPEWFRWFDKSTLDNITAWTEYYYINPDTQQWVSNFNIWDEEWEVGYINEQGEAESGDRTIRPKNFIQVSPNETYYAKGSPIARIFFYDINHNFISKLVDTSDSTFVTPSSCHYIKFLLGTAYGTTYNNDICINLSSSFNGHYEPHTINIEDILGVYNLGDLDWYHQDMGTVHDRFGSSSLQGIIKNASSGSVKGYIFSNRFVTDGYNNIYNHVNDNAIAVSNNGYILVYSSEYSTITGLEFKNLVDGSYIVIMKASSPYPL